MKKIVWANPDHQLIHTGHRTFDRQVSCISTGNVIGTTQLSSYIRAWNDPGEGLVDYPENKRPPGHLQNWDLSHLVFGITQVPNEIRNYCRENLVDHSGILYCFFHWHGRERMVHGWVMTTSHNECRLLKYWVAGQTYKSENIIRTCIEYITNPEEAS